MGKDSLEAVFAAIEKKHGAGTVSTLATDQSARLAGVIPTGLEVLDRYVLGCGGLPYGRICEVFGPESSGKTSLVLAWVAATQRAGGLAILLDAEHALTAERATSLGVDTSRVLTLDPPHLQAGGNMLRAALEALPDGGPPVLAALDSVPALLTEEEASGDEVGDELPGIRARFYGRLCRHLVPLLGRKNAHMVFVNQVRHKIGVVYGSPETTPGGNAIKFYASHRLRLWAKKRDGGVIVTVKAVKNKLAEPHREAELLLDFARGWRDDWSTVNHAKELKAPGHAGLKATEAGHREARQALGWVAAEAPGKTEPAPGKGRGRKGGAM